MLPSHSGILDKILSIVSTSLQQRQSISLASFFQCPHLHQSRFPIVICNKFAAEAWISLVNSHGSHYHTFFSVQAQTEMVEEWWNETIYCHMYLPVSGHFSLGQLPPGQLPPMKFPPGQLPPRLLPPRQLTLYNSPPDNCLRKIDPYEIPPRTITPLTITLE